MENIDGVTLSHGGDTVGFTERFKNAGKPLDFSSNGSFMGLPGAVRLAVASACETAEQYPDPLCRELRLAIAEGEGLAAENVFCAAGASDIIYRLALSLRPKRAAVFSPCFSEYEAALTAFGCEVCRMPLLEQNGFLPREGLSDEIPGDVKLIFICNPNNPTGLLYPKSFLLRLLSFAKEHRAYLVVDECFTGFCPDGEGLSMKRFLKDYDRLIILKAFTKLYGMAGIRLGYCLFKNDRLFARLYNCFAPWGVSSIAQCAGIAALKEKEYAAALRQKIAVNRRELREGLLALGLKCYDGAANFLLFYCPEPNFFERLCQSGILLRDCQNFAGLKKGFYRTAVRDRSDNEKLLAAIKEALR